MQKTEILNGSFYISMKAVTVPLTKYRVSSTGGTSDVAIFFLYLKTTEIISRRNNEPETQVQSFVLYPVEDN